MRKRERVCHANRTAEVKRVVVRLLLLLRRLARLDLLGAAGLLGPVLALLAELARGLLDLGGKAGLRKGQRVRACQRRANSRYRDRLNAREQAGAGARTSSARPRRRRCKRAKPVERPPPKTVLKPKQTTRADQDRQSNVLKLMSICRSASVPSIPSTHHFFNGVAAPPISISAMRQTSRDGCRENEGKDVTRGGHNSS